MISAKPGRLQTFLLSPAARPLRFAGTGLTAGAAQLLLLSAMTNLGVEAFAADAVAFLLAAQLNFALSVTFTWRETLGTGTLARRWVTFHGSILAMAMMNLAVFSLAGTVAKPIVAAALGIAAGALGNYAAGNLIVFRVPGDDTTLAHEGGIVA